MRDWRVKWGEKIGWFDCNIQLSHHTIEQFFQRSFLMILISFQHDNCRLKYGRSREYYIIEHYFSLFFVIFQSEANTIFLFEVVSKSFECCKGRIMWEHCSYKICKSSRGFLIRQCWSPSLPSSFFLLFHPPNREWSILRRALRMSRMATNMWVASHEWWNEILDLSHSS